MAFRRYFIMLAVLALMVSAASAQIGSAQAGASASNALACVATAAGTPQLRPESYTDLVGDILITCSGGQDLQVGTQIPLVNITITMANAAPITSRLLDSSNGSEALLIIDDAGAGLPTGATGLFGPAAPQLLCSSASQQQVGGSACPQFVGTTGGVNGNYQVAVQGSTGSAATTASANVYQGRVGAPYGPASVTFYAVPVLPPATAGVSRTFRITNIRVPSANFGGTVQANISASPSTVLPLSVTQLSIGVVGPGVSASVVANTSAFQQCLPQTLAKTATLTFTEGFATAFKTRVVPGGSANGVFGSNTNITWAAEAQNLAAQANQNIPGGLYGNFAQNSESGFIFPALNTGTATNITAGLADYGTRLKAFFTNIPAGLTLYVSTTSTSAAPANVGGTNVNPYAVLVAVNSGEATSDGNSFGASGSGLPLTASGVGSDTYNAFPLPLTSAGTAYAVWEITNANPSAQDVLKFSVYVSYTPQGANGLVGDPKQYGLPITDLPPGGPINNVDLSMGPEPSAGLFSATTLQGTGTQYTIPRFTKPPTFSGRWVSIGLCQTTLLYPYVTGAPGFDTGLAVANTSVDPFSTKPQAGSCKLYAYGFTASGGTVPQSLTFNGCDAPGTAAGFVPGQTCFAVVQPGTVQAVNSTVIWKDQAFTGYVIAVCNFQYAHGYAAITDIGVRNMFSAYLALELAPSLEAGATRGTSWEILAH